MCVCVCVCVVRCVCAYVTRYEKTDHSQLNMILQDGDLHSEDFFFDFFFLFIL